MKIEDIARLANVSKSAVSLALNDKPGVSEETREMVKRIAEENNYIPLRKSKKKKNMNQKLIRFVACKTDDIVTENYQSLPFFNELLSFIMEEIKKYPYTLSSILVDEDDYIPQLIDIENKQPSDAFILLGTNLSKEQIQDILNIQPYTVVLDTYIKVLDCDFVAINNYYGGYSAAEYLITNNHKNIGYCMGYPRIENFLQREDGFHRGLEEHGLYVNNDFKLAFPAMEINNQSNQFKHLFKLNNLPSAFFCENDYIAISLIKSLQSLGIQIPQEISVIGFDDINESIVLSPELTTMRVRKDIIAQEALKNIIQKLSTEDPNLNKVTLVNTELIERNSCKTKE